nr:SHOCT domain-containing protein [uncultured Anaerosporobacter sp.]
MTREMEYAKCIAVLRKLFRKEMITEMEYNKARQKIMDRYLIVQSGECDAA